MTPAFLHVESVPPDDGIAMTWHGWALREAFIAGAASQIRKQPLPKPPTTNEDELNESEAAAPMEDRWDYDHGPDHIREVMEG